MRSVISLKTANKIKMVSHLVFESKLMGCLSWSTDGTALVSCAKSGVYISNFTRGGYKFIKTGSSILSAKFDPTGNFLAYGGVNGILEIAHVNTGNKVASLLGHKNDISCIDYHPYQHLIASAGSWDGSIILWDADIMSQSIVFKTETRDSVLCVKFSIDGNYIYASGLNGIIYMWEISTGNLINKLRTTNFGGIRSISFNKGNSLLLAGHMNGLLQIFDMSNFEVVTSFIAHIDGIWETAFSFDGELLATGGLLDDAVRLWNLDGTELVSINEIKTNALAVAFSPNGSLIAIGGDRNIVNLYGLDDYSSSQNS